MNASVQSQTRRAVSGGQAGPSRISRWLVLLAWLPGAVMMSARAGTNDLMLRYARDYERELAGDVAGAVTGYRELLKGAAPTDPLLAEKLLYRIGECERKAGQPEAARRTWRRLVEDYPARDAQVVHTREELKALEQELDRVVMAGEVQGENGPSPAFVLTGEWGNEPVVRADSNGAFRATRKVAGQSADGSRYGLVYAEHPVLPLNAAGVFRESGSNPVFRLQPALSLSGRVVDVQGRPVVGAAIQVLGFLGDIPLPFDRLLPPVVTSGNGEFLVTGLATGVRYVVTAAKPNCRMMTAAEMDATGPVLRTDGGAISCGAIVMRRLGEISLKGRVVDESGGAVRASVTAWSLPPVERELARVVTDRTGRFMFRDLFENGIAVKVEGEGYWARTVTGLKPIGQDIDVILRNNGLSRPPALAATNDVPVPDEGGQEDLQPSPGIGVTPGGEIPVDALRWIRGNVDSAAPLERQDFKHHVVIWHFGSAYVEAALRSQYPGEPGNMVQILRQYGESGVLCVWVLPEGEERGEPARLALELYPGLPVAVLSREAWTKLFAGKAGGQGGLDPALESGNVVMGRDGALGPVCTDQQLFKAVKAAVMAR